jgi:alpha-amylase
MIGLIAWGRFVDADGNKTTVPAPSTEKDAPWLVDYLRENAAAIGAGFDVVQWPPTSKAQGGAGGGCDGYGVFDRRDLGTKNQQGSVPTRYGTLEGLMAAVAALNANGARSFGDLVLHQLIGENAGPGVFRYLGADGKSFVGRGMTTASWFRGGTGNNDPIPPFCAEDDVPSEYYDFPFGRELSYQHCSPSGVTTEDALDWLVWLSQRVGFSGYRYDDVKGTWRTAAARIMWEGAMRCAQAGAPIPQFYSEYFDGNPANLSAWAFSPEINGISGLEDFTLHWRLQAACNGFDATQLVAGGSAGFWQWASGLAVAFVDNPDTDTSPGQQVIFNKGIAYAYILTLPCRMAMVYGKDYFPSSLWPGAYGLKPLIDNLCWISRMFAIGNYQVRWVDRDVHVATRDGNGGALGWSGGLLTAINFNVLAPRTITCGTPFGPNKQLHDYTGRHDDIWTDGNGNATFTIPSNAFSGGQSYLCFAPAGVSKPYPIASRRVTQVFTGSLDLDVAPARNGMQSLPQRLHCAEGLIDVKLQLDLSDLKAPAAVQVEIVDPTGALVAWGSTGPTDRGAASGIVKNPGWHTVRLIGNLLPDAGIPFTLSAAYLGAA